MHSFILQSVLRSHKTVSLVALSFLIYLFLIETVHINQQSDTVHKPEVTQEANFHLLPPANYNKTCVNHYN